MKKVEKEEGNKREGGGGGEEEWRGVEGRKRKWGREEMSLTFHTPNLHAEMCNALFLFVVLLLQPLTVRSSAGLQGTWPPPYSAGGELYSSQGASHGFRGGGGGYSDGGAGYKYGSANRSHSDGYMYEGGDRRRSTGEGIFGEGPRGGGRGGSVSNSPYGSKCTYPVQNKTLFIQ